MRLLKKILISSVASFFLLGLSSNLVFAGDFEAVDPGSTVLPTTDKKIEDCKILLNEVAISKNEITYDDSNNTVYHGAINAVAQKINFNDNSYKDILACGIKTGDISLWMIPFYIRFILEFIIGLAGLLAVGGIVYGGYLYLFAGISEDKDKGKKAIMYGVGGMVLTLISWALVNIVIALVSS